MKIASFAFLLSLIAALSAEAVEDIQITPAQCNQLKQQCVNNCAWEYPYNGQFIQRAWCRYQNCNSICH